MRLSRFPALSNLVRIGRALEAGCRWQEHWILPQFAGIPSLAKQVHAIECVKGTGLASMTHIPRMVSIGFPASIGQLPELTIVRWSLVVSKSTRIPPCSPS